MSINLETTTRGFSLTLVHVLACRSRYAAAVRLGAIVLAAAATAAAAQVAIPLPMTAVPLTLQPTVVLLSGAALGSRLGAWSQVLYLAAGALGLQAFSFAPWLPTGAARLVGPTAGFLLSFPLAAWVVGSLAERGLDRRWLTLMLSLAAGLAVIFAGGALWIAYGPPAPVGLAAALSLAVYPFVALDLLKISVAAALLPLIWRRLRGSAPE